MRGTAGGPFDNTVSRSLSGQSVPYGEANNGQGSMVGRMVTEIYYIGRGQGGSTATKNNIGQDVWSLWRKTSDEAPV